MASIIEKNYSKNPYVYDMVNVLWRFCKDYDEAQRTLAKNPNEIRAALVRAYCLEFARWLSETMEADFYVVGETIVRMMEEGYEEE